MGALLGRVEGGVMAVTRFQHVRHFDELMGLLKENPGFTFAAEQLDRVAGSFERRFGRMLPCPDEITQNDDATLIVFWPGFGLYCARDFVGWMYVALGSQPSQHMHPEVTGIPDEILQAIEIADRSRQANK